MFLVNVLGVLPFCAMGLFVGSLVSGQAAPAIVNLIYLPMAFLSGLWVPMQFLGKTHAADSRRSGRRITCCSLSLDGGRRAQHVGSTVNHIGALIGVTVLFYALAVRRLSGAVSSLFGAARARLRLSRCAARSASACSGSPSAS